MNEIWKPIVGYPNYQVSSLGNVRNARAIMLTHKRRGKYLAVELYHQGCGRFFNIHTLVLTAFVGKRPIGMESCHNNGDEHDNRLTNLRWDTRLGNAIDRTRHGTVRTRNNNHYRAILTREDVERIKRDSRPSRLVAADYGCSSSLIRNIRCGIAK